MNKIIRLCGNNDEDIYVNFNNVLYFKPFSGNDHMTEIGFISGEKYRIVLQPKTVAAMIEEQTKYDRRRKMAEGM